jgi:hypothetical protein
LYATLWVLQVERLPSKISFHHSNVCWKLCNIWNSLQHIPQKIADKIQNYPWAVQLLIKLMTITASYEIHLKYFQITVHQKCE